MAIDALSSAATRSPLIAATFAGGLAAGLLDIAYAFVAYRTIGVSPTAVLQSIASGLLGRDAYRGGVSTAALGLALHFLIAIAMAAVFVAASRQWPRLVEQPIRWGVVYGLLLYALMNHVVLPLSAFPGAGRPTPLPLLLGGLAIHALGVGVPIALAARRFAGPLVR